MGAVVVLAGTWPLPALGVDSTEEMALAAKVVLARVARLVDRLVA